MKLNGTDRIIYEDDIILNNPEETLSGRLNNQLKDIDKLKSNVKWIYKYGGVGSGSGGGGGPSTTFGIFATIGGYLIESKDIVLDGSGSYKLYIKINNPNGGKFNIKYSYYQLDMSGNPVKREKTKILSIENNFEFEENITLDTNNVINIQASDGNNTQLVSCNYITTSYTFNLSLVNNKDKVYSDKEIFIDNAIANGLQVKFDYDIAVKALVSYLFSFLDKKYEKKEISDKHGFVNFEIPKEILSYDKAGAYLVILDVELSIENLETIYKKLDISFNLIPNDLYLLLSPEEGFIYTEEQKEEQRWEYNAGYILLKARVFLGTNNSRTYTLKYTINDKEFPEIYVVERVLLTISILSTKEGLNTLNIEVRFGDSVYKKKYYFYIKKNLFKLDWYDELYLDSGVFNYYRLDTSTDAFSSLLGVIKLNINKPKLTIDNIPLNVSSAAAKFNTHVAIGILYSLINSSNDFILKLSNKLSGSYLDVLTLSLRRLNVKTDIDCYVPISKDFSESNTDEYHLISIYSRFIKLVGTDNYYEISLYIDGVLESAFLTLFNSPLLGNRLILNNINCYVNLLEISYMDVTDNMRESDLDMYQYYLKYKNTILSYKEDETSLIENLKSFKYDSENVLCNSQSILNIALAIKIPTIVFTIQDNDNTVLSNLNSTYLESETAPNFDCTVLWSLGKLGLHDVNIEEGNATFNIAILGTSTKGYKCKNYELSISSSSRDVKLFSPNFRKLDPSTFLPEESFTLKADVVDSSHSNNTSIGKFVNDVCVPFSLDMAGNSEYKPFIKNCLEGFPILVYIHLVHQKQGPSGEVQTTEEYYYLGIYNFNLGRKSFFNLGYKNLKVFEGSDIRPPLKENLDGFTFYSIPEEENGFIKDLTVSEILSNSEYFDFSQYDPSILFKRTDISNDNAYMLGDIQTGNKELSLNILLNLIKHISHSGGRIFEYLKKNFGDQLDAYHAIDENGNSINQVPNYLILYKRDLSEAGSWQYTPQEVDPEELGTVELEVTNLITHDTSDLATRRALLNYDSLSEYYTICMAFGLVDSVLKNLNIKTWDGKTFYVAFYDMDTCLGINNAGRDTSYFAFSDYWKLNIESESDSTVVPKGVIIYRDFYPFKGATGKASLLTNMEGRASANEENGFDVPSSYLFAVAKYARIILDNSEFTINYPLELWARWRSMRNTLGRDRTVGCLLNAKLFILEYFASNIKSVPEPLISFNYRNKYFLLNDIIYNNTNFEKFKGTKIYKTLDWLDGRFHLLDAYFNLNRSTSVILYYDKETKEWNNVQQSENYVLEPMYREGAGYTLNNNPDVYILRDIFTSGNTGLTCQGNLLFTIKAEENSPLAVKNALITRRYLIENKDKLYKIAISLPSDLSVTLGGSSLWTWLNSINDLNATSLYVESNKLEFLNGDRGNTTGFTLKMPALKELVLTSPGYKGTLNLNNKGDDLHKAIEYPNILSINISNSQINTELNSLDVNTINIEKMNSSNVSIMNCNKLRTLNFGNYTTIKNLNISPLPENLNNINANNLRCGKLTLMAHADKEGIFKVDNNLYLNTLELTNFKSVHINNCNHLGAITLTNSNIPLESLYINNSGNLELTINSETKKTIDLSKCTKLKELTLSELLGIDTVILPGGIKLKGGCFRLCKNLKYVKVIPTLKDTNIYLLGTGTFLYCEEYTLKLGPNLGYTPIKIDSSCTDISSTFEVISSGVLTIEDVKYFLELCISSDNNITKVSNLFYRLKNIIYEKEDLIKSLKGNSSNYIKLENLKKTSDISGMFRETGVCAVYKEMFKGLGDLIDSAIKYNEFVYGTGKNIFYTIDSLYYLIDKIANFNSWGLIFMLDSLGNDLNNYKLSNFFTYVKDGVRHYPVKMSSIYRVDFDNSQTVDLAGVFTKEWKSLSYIGWFLTNGSNKILNLDNLLKLLPALKTIEYSFMLNYPEPIDLMNFINWEEVLKDNRGSLFGGQYLWNSFTIKKRITSENFKKLIDMIAASKITSMSYIFCNCTVKANVALLLKPETINTSITSMCLTFSNCKFKLDWDSDVDLPIHIDDDFFEAFPNITILRETFRNTYIKKLLPFNFFRKRYETIEKGIYYKDTIEDEDVYKPAIVYTYKYRNNITEMGYCFYNVRWDTPSYTNLEEEIPLNRITDLEGHVIDTLTYYRLEGGNYYHSDISESIELQDFNVPLEGVGSGYYVEEFNSEGAKFYNYTLRDKESVHKNFIVPDILYGCSDNCVISGCFGSDSTNLVLEGLIPKHLLLNCKKVSISNFFKNLNLLPRLLKTIDSGNTSTNVYYYIPENFTDTLILDNAFNFLLNLPQSYSKAGKKYINAVYVLLHNSLNKNIQYMLNALPSSYKGDPRNYYPNTSNTDFNIHYNIMVLIRDNYIKDGLDINTYSILALDNLINGMLSRFYYGHVFNLEFHIEEANKKTNESIIKTSTIENNYNNIISCKLILPAANKPFTHIHLFGNLSPRVLTINSNLIEESSNSLKYYKELYDSDSVKIKE